MCTGLEVAAAVTAASAVAGTGIAVSGQIQQQRAQKAAAEYQGKIYERQSKIDEYNASVMEEEALAVEEKTGFDVDRHREDVKRILSAQRAQYGAKGVDLTGSPLLVQLDTARQGELDALAIRYGGDVEAAQRRSKANLIKMGSIKRGTPYVGSSVYGVGQTLLSGVNTMAGTYSDYRRTKALEKALA